MGMADRPGESLPDQSTADAGFDPEASWPLITPVFNSGLSPTSGAGSAIPVLS